MKKFLRIGKVLLTIGLVSVMMTTTVYGSGYPDGTFLENELESDGGSYCKNAITGEIFYEPPVSTHSNETEWSSPEYNPYADEDNDDCSVQPNLVCK